MVGELFPMQLKLGLGLLKLDLPNQALRPVRLGLVRFSPSMIS